MGLVAPQHVGSSAPGLEPVSTALAGGFLTTAPPGKPPKILKLVYKEMCIRMFTAVLFLIAKLETNI